VHSEVIALSIRHGLSFGKENQVKYITLTGIHGQGKTAIVDDADYGKLVKYSWYLSQGYAIRKPGTGVVSMHASVLPAVLGMHIDHINGDPLDNRRSNLRIVTPSQNGANRNRLNVNNKSGYMGVHKTYQRPTWTAKVQVGFHSYNAGRYRDPEEAAWMYDQWKLALQGEFATLNFEYA